MGYPKAASKSGRVTSKLTHSYSKLFNSAHRTDFSSQVKTENELGMFAQIVRGLEYANDKINDLEQDRLELYGLLMRLCNQDPPKHLKPRQRYSEPTVSSTAHRHQRAELLTLREKLEKLEDDKLTLARNLASTRSKLYTLEKDRNDVDEQFGAFEKQVQRLYKQLDRVGDELDVWQQTAVKLAKKNRELDGENTVLAQQLLDREQILQDLHEGVETIRSASRQQSAATTFATPTRAQTPVPVFAPAAQPVKTPPTKKYTYGPADLPSTASVSSSDDDEDGRLLYERALQKLGESGVSGARAVRGVSARSPVRVKTAKRRSASPRPQSAGYVSISPLPPARLNLNTCAVADLMAIPHMGPIRANRIVLERRANGPFQDFYDFAQRLKPQGVEAGSCLRLIRHGFYILN